MNKIIKLETQQEVQALFGLHDENIRAIEQEFKVKIALRGEHLKVSGTAAKINRSASLIDYLLKGIRSGEREVGKTDLRFLMSNFKRGKDNSSFSVANMGLECHGHGTHVGPRTAGQREYTEAIKKHDIVFGIGPAGTGKTYLAMACAVEALKNQEVRRLTLTRPLLKPVNP